VSRRTRRDRAIDLRRRLTNGPAFGDIAIDFTTEEASAQFRRWSQSWILEDLVDLIPELRAIDGRLPAAARQVKR
jgi:hypothetical protein